MFDKSTMLVGYDMIEKKKKKKKPYTATRLIRLYYCKKNIIMDQNIWQKDSSFIEAFYTSLLMFFPTLGQETPLGHLFIDAL